MALLLALAGCSAAPSTEEPGTASQTKYATGKYTQTEVTPAVDSGFAPAKLQMLDGVPTLSLYNDAQNTAAAFSWTGDGWETIDPSTVQAFLDGLDKTQVETLTACYGGSGEIFLTMQQRVFPAIKKMKYGRLPDFDENGELMETIDAVRENAVHVTA